MPINVQELRIRAKKLPSLPASVVALNQTIQDERCTVDRLLGILQKDPPLSASLLRLANSALYAGEGEVRDLKTAILRLGFDAVANLGTSVAVIKTLKGSTRLDALALWRHSVAVGLVARGISKLVKKHGDAETAFLGGLLHDIGKLALDFCFPEEYEPVVRRMQEQGMPAVDAEKELLGLNHAEAGAILANQWVFPEVIVGMIRDHHAPPKGEYLPNLIHLADLLVRTRIPNSPADELLVVSLAEEPTFPAVFGHLKQALDLELLTFQIDDELDHAMAFVDLAYQS
jgi:putative nucleotidyltransferase with HDIG domain